MLRKPRARIEVCSQGAVARAEGTQCASDEIGMDLPLQTMGDVVVVELPLEELDASNAAELKSGVAPMLEQHPKMVLDLRRLRFIDSSGLGAFLSCLRKAAERGGDLKLCGMSKTVRGVFELVRMHRIFDIQPTREAALRAFAPAAPQPVPA
jgi:anti-sigma B factor antagonist